MKINQPISVIVKAYNEEKNIARVLKVIGQISWIDEIVVIDDGSQDKTADVVLGFKSSKIRLVQHKKNQGMGGAMATGIKASRNNLLLFLDADLIGLKESHLLRLLAPVLFTREADLALGVFGLKRLSKDAGTKIANRFLPMITGQRAIWKKSLPPVSKIAKSRYGADLLIARHVSKERRAVVKLDGLSQVTKEKKAGGDLVKIFRARFIMYQEVSRVLLHKKSSN
ncbi:MAG: glycosyltransferase family 2 protein [Candidatus Berkelbacteria bacterium]|nr:glycosyltransferase family 2 protein [Candidatus Berkelbacteria bacterium]